MSPAAAARRLSPLGPRSTLSRLSRYTARFHVPAAMLEGLVAGAYTLNDIILRKNFGAGPLVVTLLVMAQPVSQLLAIVWGSVMQGREKRPFILGFGGFGRLALVLVALATTSWMFLVPIGIAITLAVAIVPALNSIYQTNYPDKERGRVFGWVMGGTSIATMAASLGAGALMDWNPQSFRVIYPVAGVLGLISASLFYRIRQRRTLPSARITRALPGADTDAPPHLLVVEQAQAWGRDIGRALRNPLHGAASAFRDDRRFARFEIGFMIYGIAWMMMQPVIPIFLVDTIHVQYHQVGVARGVIYFTFMALFSPLAGRLLDRWNAVRVAALGFAMLATFPFAMMLCHDVRHVYIAFALYGVGMAGANMAWTMGPILFAGKRDAAGYMGVHVTMVGIRGLLGNPLGLLLLQTIGARSTFGICSALFAVSVLYMWRLGRDMERDAAHGGTPAESTIAAAR